MVVLEKVAQMKETGMSDPQIIQSLKQEGFSPREINDALSQSRIKDVIDYEEYPEVNQPVKEMAMQQNPRMQQSIMSRAEQQQKFENYPQPPEGYPPPAPETYSEIPSAFSDAELTQEQAPLPEDYQQYSPEYQNYQEYQPPQAMDIETMNEIAEQISEEKNEKLKKEIMSFVKFREEMTSEIIRLSERVQKIETLFDDLQMAIIKKIGSYGEDIKNISKEIHATQNSFSKILDPLTENIKELERISGKSQEKSIAQSNPKIEKQENQSRKVQKKQKMDFEDYLR